MPSQRTIVHLARTYLMQALPWAQSTRTTFAHLRAQEVRGILINCVTI
jgi:hypothetical protein